MVTNKPIYSCADIVNIDPRYVFFFISTLFSFNFVYQVLQLSVFSPIKFCYTLILARVSWLNTSVV